MLRTLAGLAALALFAAPAIAADPPAAPPPTKRIANATVVSFKSDKLVVTSEDGKEKFTVAFNADTKILRNRAGTKADLKPGVFVGCTAVEGADGKLRATEIRIFPEAMRGMGEGHYPWPVDNPEPATTMTNGNVETATGVTDGRVIKVSYKDPKTGQTGMTEIIIPDTVIVQVTEIVGKENLKPGAKVSINAAINADGSLTARFVRIIV